MSLLDFVTSFINLFIPFYHSNTPSSLYEIELHRLDGTLEKLEIYRGRVLLLVNVASRCGYVDQYRELQQLYEKYSEQGLVILGFPSNDFLWQEPGDSAQILQLCRSTYGVSFPMYEKIHVRGYNCHPLYRLLQKTGRVTWNFNKYLCSASGEPLLHFKAGVKPSEAHFIEAIEAALHLRNEQDQSH